MLRRLIVRHRNGVAFLADEKGQLVSLQELLDPFPDGQHLMIGLWRRVPIPGIVPALFDEDDLKDEEGRG